MTKVLYSLALLNRTYFTKGWGKNTEQIMNFQLKPARLDALMETIMYAQAGQEIREACEQLTADTLELLREQKEAYASGPSYPDRMKGFYEEVKGILDKIVTACEKNDYPSAFFWAAGAQDEIARFLHYAEKGFWPASLEPNLTYQTIFNQAGFPNLLPLLDPGNLIPLQEAVERLDAHLKRHLLDQGVAIHSFENLMQFQEYLRNRQE